MRVSVITVTHNSAATVADTLDSVKRQDHPDIEHILVDGNSSDNTVDIISSYAHVSRWISEPDGGLYEAINKGIRMATGDVVGILNSDDFFPNKSIVSKIARTLDASGMDAVYGDIAFVRPERLDKVTRLYSSRRFAPGRFARGYMPAHPSFYVRRACYENFGLYEIDYKIAADYELLMRFIHTHGVSLSYIPEVLVFMRTGGVSNRNLRSRYTLNREIMKACRANGVNTNMVKLSLKYFSKVFEYIRPGTRNAGRLK